jgi:hypothetical protein
VKEPTNHIHVKGGLIIDAEINIPYQIYAHTFNFLLWFREGALFLTLSVMTAVHPTAKGINQLNSTKASPGKYNN